MITGKAAVRKVIRDHQQQVLDLGVEQAKAFMPVLDKAQAELGAQLHKWVTTDAKGELRWTPHSYRNALIQIHHSQKALREKMADRLSDATSEAQPLAISHLEESVATMSEAFGKPMRLSVKSSSVIASGESYRVQRYETSAARYSGMYSKDIQERLAVDVLKGSRVHETIKALQESGGPSGLVHMGGGRYEMIEEGLFTRYRYWAERLVRTEVSSAYCTTSRDARRDAGAKVHGLKKKWIADGRACSDCLEQSEEVVEEHDLFMPSGVSDPPAHPFCSCSVLPWGSDWDELIGDLFD